MMASRILPSPDWLEDMEPLARTNPADPQGDRWWIMCCTQAKVGVAGRWHTVAPALVVLQPVTAPVGNIERRISEDVVGFEVGVAVVVEGVPVGDLAFDSPGWRGSSWLDARWCSWIPARRSRCRPGRGLRCRSRWRGARMNSTDWTNIPDDPQQGS